MSHPTNTDLTDRKIDKMEEKLTPQEFMKFLGLDKEYTYDHRKKNHPQR